MSAGRDKNRSMDDRVTDLEIRYTHQERLVEELSMIVHQQRELVAKLEGRVRDLEQRLMALEEPSAAEPPPHY